MIQLHAPHPMQVSSALRQYMRPVIGACAIALGLMGAGPSSASLLGLSQSPLFLTSGQAPLVLLTMARDHKLYYAAYNDYSDLDGDGALDVGYKPSIDYYGYFDSYKCYTYDSGNGRFAPSSITADKKCSAKWSGDFLNYVTMARIDALRKVLYGGYRSTDTSSLTVLERTFVPQDGHSWGKEYQSVARDGYDISQYTPLALPAANTYHLFANTTLTSETSPPLMRVLTNSKYRVWEWLAIERPVADSKCATGNNVRANCTTGGAVMTDYKARVEVCNQTVGLEANCQTYGTSNKPVGLLQRQGESNGMYFGLLTGSYTHNTEGGVMRKAISSINNEITSDGRFGATSDTCNSGSNCVNGIIGTINNLKFKGFNYSDHSHQCGWIDTRQMNDGECYMWGNPIGEMVYEGIRYFSGKTTPTTAFTYSATDSALIDNVLGLPQLTTWTNPYSTTPDPAASPATFASCSKPYSMLVSDVYPSFDSNSVPGADSNFSSFSGDISGMNVSTLGQTMWNAELGGGMHNIFVGQSGATYDGTPTAKSATSFGNIRGLSPAEPSRQGSYYSAAAAYYGHTHDLNPIAGDQKLNTYSIALASPLPNIEIPVGANKVTVMPFAKSVGGASISAASGSFQPTNQIVGFYIDTIRNVTGSPTDAAVNGGRAYYKFRISYEDSEQGADHDMDAIGLYEIKLNADNTISISISSDYAAGGIIQHMGFAISGTGATDKSYLMVRDSDTAAASDPVYFLDCRSATTNPTDCVGTGGTGALPLFKELKFTASSTGSATLLKDPLWYAAKWGSFVDDNGNSLPDTTEWSANYHAGADNVPDNYFMVTNPLKLETQLTNAFDKIKNDSATAAATSTNSFSYQSDSALYQARFSNDGWSGELNAYPINLDKSLGAATWQAQYKLATATSATRTILTYDPDATTKGIPFLWASMTSTGTPYLRTSLNKAYTGTVDGLGSDRVSYLRGDSVTDMRTRPFIKSTTTINKLGDIISSQPQYVALPDFGYSETTYVNFRAAHENRTPMVYVGANDGMLHGFSATDGTEKIAYVPSEMYRTRSGQPLLSKLTASNYGQSTNPHHYYVDGSATVGDVCTAGCAAATDWKTILVGGLNGGGQGIYALDITNPANFSEANASTLVMWEFNDRQDADLGYTYSRPAIVRICTSRTSGSTTTPKSCDTGRWVVIFGNGYNNSESDGSGNVSATGYAYLYVVDALTGTLIKKISTKAGSSGTPNGLATVAAIDVDNDTYTDYVYAGDLLGNLWKFDLTDDNVSHWDSAYKTGGDPDPLYIAKDSTSNHNVQKITTAPDALLHPNGGVQIFFGTGSYLTNADKSDASIQSVYGIWDNAARVSSADRTNLQQQTVNTTTATMIASDYRTISANTVDWATKKGWYIDLPESGERISYDPRILGHVLGFTSTIPSGDICSYGGTSWDYFVDAFTGGNLAYSAFLNIPADKFGGSIDVYASARQSKVGITPVGTLITQGKGRGTNIECGSTGNCDSYEVNLGQNISGRVSWREILSD